MRKAPQNIENKLKNIYLFFSMKFQKNKIEIQINRNKF